MIRDIELWDAFERELVRRDPPDHLKNMAIAEALLREARALGVFPPKDPLDGLDADIRIAEALRHV